MRHRKTPQQKKAEAYDNEYITAAEYPQSFQKQWPRKKRRVNRSDRKRASEGVRRAALDPDASDLALRSKPKRRLYKWTPVTLRESVAGRLQRRVTRMAWNYFKHPYDKATHETRFTAFVTELMKTPATAGHNADFARRLHRIIDVSAAAPDLKTTWPNDQKIRAWLNGYFADQPALEERLRRWAADA